MSRPIFKGGKLLNAIRSAVLNAPRSESGNSRTFISHLGMDHPSLSQHDGRQGFDIAEPGSEIYNAYSQKKIVIKDSITGENFSA